MPGASTFAIKLIADRGTQRFLGVQVAGPGAVDKIVDITVTAIQCGATLDQMDGADFAYAPPFSTAIHPFAHTLNILKNKLNGAFETFTPAEFAQGLACCLLYTSSGTRIVFENYMRAARIPIRVVGESTSSTAIIEMVMSGLGLGVLSRRCVQRYTSKNLICACTIQGMPMSRYFYICYQTGHPITSQMADFIRVSQQSVQMTSFLSQEGACNETMATF